MGQLYGCWLTEDFDYASIAGGLKDPHKEYFPFFERRVDAIFYMAGLFVQEIYDIYPALAGKVNVSYVSTVSAVGRYVNDIMHYKIWHNVKITNKSKMIAHTVKWLSHYQIISTSVTPEEYSRLPPRERELLLELNTIFIGTVIRYFLAFFCDGEIPPSKTYEKIFYLVDTGQYDAKTAAIAFDGLII